MKLKLIFPKCLACFSCTTLASLLMVYLAEFQNALSEEKFYYLLISDHSLLLLISLKVFLADKNARILFTLFLLFLNKSQISHSFL